MAELSTVMHSIPFQETFDLVSAGQPKTVHMSNAEYLTLSSGPNLTVSSQNESQLEMRSTNRTDKTCTERSAGGIPGFFSPSLHS